MNWIKDLIDWSQPQVTAALIAATVALLLLFINVILALVLQWWKVKSDNDLALRKFEFDTKLAERKFLYDQQMNDHKRRVELAEEVMSGFYQMVDVARSIRSSFGYAGEGKKRVPSAYESPEVAQSRDAYYAIAERFEERRKEIADLFTRRYRMTALFGKDADRPFEILHNSFNQVLVSARLLIEWADQDMTTRPEDRNLVAKMKGDIWEGASDPDPIANDIQLAVELIEKICGPVLRKPSE